MIERDAALLCPRSRKMNKKREKPRSGQNETLNPSSVSQRTLKPSEVPNPNGAEIPWYTVGFGVYIGV